MIDRAIRDLVAVTTARIEAHAVEDIAAVRACPVPLVGFSDTLHAELGVLKRFLHARMYRHYRVHRMAVKAQRVITDLFTAYSQDERLLPPQFLGRWQAQSTARTRARVVADYVAGMTDRYALTEHRRLYDPGALG